MKTMMLVLGNPWINGLVQSLYFAVAAVMAAAMLYHTFEKQVQMPRLIIYGLICGTLKLTLMVGSLGVNVGWIWTVIYNQVLWVAISVMLGCLVRLPREQSVVAAQYQYFALNAFAAIAAVSRAVLSFLFKRIMGGEFGDSTAISALAAVLAGVIVAAVFFCTKRVLRGFNLFSPGTTDALKSTLAVNRSIAARVLVVLAYFAVSAGIGFWMEKDPQYAKAIGGTGVFVLVVSFALLLYYDQCKNLKSNIKTKTLAVESLVKTIDDFSGLKHDINNMMQVYHGYISLGNYEALKVYHEKVFSLVQESSNNTKSIEVINKNPVLLGLIEHKRQRAQEHDVELSLNIMDTSGIEAMSSFDFGRMMGIILDNAIEAASESEKKIILFSVEAGYEYALVTVSNSTAGDVDVEKIFNKGHTSKSGHMGRGLWEVQKIIAKNEHFTVDFTCNANMFTMKMKVENPGAANDALMPEDTIWQNA